MRTMSVCSLLTVVVLGIGIHVLARAQTTVGGINDVDEGAPVITILSTMLADSISGEAYSSYGEWGFAALVEVGGVKYLYDTGYHPDLVLKNAEKLGIDLAEVEQVILSHTHIDHVGGLMVLREALMKKNPAALSIAHVASGFFAEPEDSSRSGRDDTAAIMDAYRATGGTIIVHESSVEIAAGVWLSGPVTRIHDERNWSGSALIRTADGVAEDNVPEDMAMIIETSKGLVVISGCGHAGIINILDHAISATGEEHVVAAIGGFHLFQADDEALQWTASHFRRVGLTYFLGAHCTGIEATLRLRELAGLDRTNAVVGAVGQRYGPEGIYAGRIAR